MAKTIKPAVIFGVFLAAAGSYSLGDFLFLPYTATPVPPETRDAACPVSSPVQFFDTKDEADARIAELRAEHERRPKG
jgi:hypothetical protein